MENYYKVLGINSSATVEEVRRAYRILARRYHPDVNPGEASTERFKLIAQAYDVLSDPERRRNYDIEFEREAKEKGNAAQRAYRRAARAKSQADTRRRYEDIQARHAARVAAAAQVQKKKAKGTLSETVAEKLRSMVTGLKGAKIDKTAAARGRSVQKISVVEVSLTLRDAIQGVKKTIEISEPEGSRKVSVRIPAGSRNGSVVHLRSTQPPGEELVLIVRVAAHPNMSLQPKGLVVEVPITVAEAIWGASISVPTLEDPISLKVPPGSQSGTELRVRERGVTQKDGTRGDLFYRLLVRVPDNSGVGIKEKAQEIEKYYGSPVRQQLPRTLLD